MELGREVGIWARKSRVFQAEERPRPRGGRKGTGREGLRRDRLSGKKIRGQKQGKIEVVMSDQQTRLEVEKAESTKEVKGHHER